MTSQAEYSPHESPQQMVPDEMPWFLPDEVRSIKRELAHLWEFVWQEGLGDDAQEFVSDRRDIETSFELY